MSTEVEYVGRAPSVALRPWVTNLWYTQGPAVQRFEKILPMPIIHFVVNLAEPYRLVSRGRVAIGSSFAKGFVSGLQTRYLVIENPATLRNMGAEFTPYGLAAFSSTGMAQLADRVIEGEEVLAGSGRLRDAAVSMSSGDEALALLDDYLCATLRPGFEANRHAKQATDMISDDPGLPISDVARRCGISHKALIENFRRHAGVTPKVFANLCRFHRFLTELPMGDRMPTWSELVSRTGYYDQPHFVRAFREFTGFTPSGYLETMRRFGPEYPSFVPMGESGLAEG